MKGSRDEHESQRCVVGAGGGWEARRRLLTGQKRMCVHRVEARVFCSPSPACSSVVSLVPFCSLDVSFESPLVVAIVLDEEVDSPTADEHR